MGLRRAVAGTAGHGHRFLSFTDNMSSLLAFDRGRSHSYDLLCLCRRAAALCSGGDVFCGVPPRHFRLNMFLGVWVFRFVSTKN